MRPLAGCADRPPAALTRRAALGVLAAAPAVAGEAARGIRRAHAAAPGDLTALLEPIRAGRPLPALAGAIVRGEALVAIGAVGRRAADAPEPVDAESRFHLGSCTKAMTATMIARLVEQGRLAWTTTIAEGLPELRAAIHPGYRRVTLLQLLSHRGGLPEDRRPDPALWDRLRALRGPLPRQRQALCAMVLAAPPAAEPGARKAYSNFGYVVAGAIAERVTRDPWETLMRGLVFSPLAMASAGFGPPGPGQPIGHEPERCAPVPDLDNPALLGPAGAVHASLRDWAAFASAHLRGARGDRAPLLSSAAYAELHRDRGDEYGLGWAVVRRDWARGVALNHAGSNGLWQAVVWLAPERDAGYLAATNCGGNDGFQACDRAVAAMIQAAA
jgi:CubicO group peptidase (beta-lactamase class C family)